MSGLLFKDFTLGWERHTYTLFPGIQNGCHRYSYISETVLSGNQVTLTKTEGGGGAEIISGLYFNTEVALS